MQHSTKRNIKSVWSRPLSPTLQFSYPTKTNYHAYCIVNVLHESIKSLIFLILTSFSISLSGLAILSHFLNFIPFRSVRYSLLSNLSVMTTHAVRQFIPGFRWGSHVEKALEPLIYTVWKLFINTNSTQQISTIICP